MNEPKEGEIIKPETAEKVEEIKKSWIEAEAETLKNSNFDGEKKPALKLEEGKVKTVEIDFTNEFDSWTDPENGNIKKIIPCKSGGEECVWWLNVRNPVYSQIIQKGANGQTVFKVLQTGSKQNTRYTIVEEAD